MSQVIKFRVWDSQYNHWVYPRKERMVPAVFFAPDGTFAYSGLSSLTPETAVVEQFVGLSDAKGREIYEGDIVITVPSPGCLTSIISPDEFTMYTHGTIELVCGSWKICQAHIGATPLYDFADCECCPAGSIKIIGNIHENPDLLS